MTHTIKPSPKRQLEAELGITPQPKGKRNGDWIKFNCGDKVVAIGDPRHVGEVRAISSSVWVTVHWLESGWRSVMHTDKLRRADEQ